LTEELTKCAVHSRQEISENEIYVYFESLKDRDPAVLRAAIRRCREALDYVPKLHEIISRLESVRYFTYPDLGGIAREWVEGGVRYCEYRKAPGVRFFVRFENHAQARQSG
jgi:hypothetical protein